MSKRDLLALRDYLEHIAHAIGRIQQYLAGIEHTEFLQNPEKQDAVIRNLEVIGEAAGNIYKYFPDFCVEHPRFPLKAAYATRNALSHGYFKVDLDVVWMTVERDMPMLSAQVSEVLRSLMDESQSHLGD